jgi:aspartyl protease family protein
MLRNYLIIMVVIGVLGSCLGRGTPSSRSREHEIFQAAADSQPRQSGESVESGGSFDNRDGSVELNRSGDGHFYADVTINGAAVHMLVDTGATGIALSREDARSAGLATSIGMNDVVGQGADGAVRGEFAQLDRVELGPLSAEGMNAIILNSGEQSLLGQSFLSKFGSVEIHGDRMVLR